MKEQTKNTLDRSQRIRQLNDKLRTTGGGGLTVVTNGIASLSPATALAVYAAVECFDHFSADNDPYGEHDCAAIAVGGANIIWKIDYFDRSRRYPSPDPTDPKLTFRVLTIMLAEEY